MVAKLSTVELKISSRVNDPPLRRNKLVGDFFARLVSRSPPSRRCCGSVPNGGRLGSPKHQLRSIPSPALGSPAGSVTGSSSRIAEVGNADTTQPELLSLTAFPCPLMRTAPPMSRGETAGTALITKLSQDRKLLFRRLRKETCCPQALARDLNATPGRELSGLSTLLRLWAQESAVLADLG
jgi:hypothetical protein